MLRVQADQPFRIQVQAQLEGASPLKFGGDSAGNWYYALPKTGTYRVLYGPWQTTPGIQFDFLSKDDPRADPGINRDQVTVDFGAFARNEELVIAPLDIDEEGEDYLDSRPTHLAVDHPDFEFRIMTVAANKKVFKEYERMTALEAAIRAHGKGADVEKLPYSIYRGGGVNLWTQPEYVDGEGWRGLHWLGGFAQDVGCFENMGGQELGYYFEGLTGDGKYFILVRSHISNPKLAHQFGKDCAEGGSLNGVFQKDMKSMNAASFTPNLDQLDAVIKSLKLKR
jgi:hypothetical protein